MGFEKVFHNLTFKRMDALREQFQSLVDCFELLFLDTCDGNQTLTMIIRNKSL